MDVQLTKMFKTGLINLLVKCDTCNNKIVHRSKNSAYALNMSGFKKVDNLISV